MKNSTRWGILVLASIATIAAWGCSQKKEEAAAPPVAQQAPTPAASSSGAAEKEESGPTVAPAGTVPEIWTQIQDEQGKLSTAIQNGQLKDVHHLAFGIRDLVVAIADKAAPVTTPKLKAMVEQVKTSASKLDELGDAGNLSGTQAEYAKLENMLKAIKSATAGQ